MENLNKYMIKNKKMLKKINLHHFIKISIHLAKCQSWSVRGGDKEGNALRDELRNSQFPRRDWISDSFEGPADHGALWSSLHLSGASSQRRQESNGREAEG